MGEALAGRRRWIWLAVAVVVLALIAFGVVRALTAGATEKPKAPVTAAADRGAVTTEVATTGTVQPAQTRSLSFAVKGTVQSVSVRAGTTVTAGQVLAKVDDTDAATAVGNAQDALNEAQDNLTKARSSSTSSSNAGGSTGGGCGTNVAAAYTWPTSTGSPTATSSPSPTPTATRTPTAAPTATSRPTATAAPTATAPGGNSGNSGNSGNTGGGSGSGTGSGSGNCGGSTGGGSNGGGSTGGGASGGGGSDPILSAEQRVTQANTTLEEAEEALEGATIKAPIAGRVISVAGKVGSQVSAGSTFITLADVYDMQISADYPEADADRLAVGQKGVITLPDQVGKEFKATVVQVDPVGTSDGTMVRYGVLLSFDDAPEDLLVGQSASVKVTTGAKDEVLRVPSTAVHDVHGDSGTVLQNGAQVKVGVGLRGDQYTEITSGLTEGAVVVRSW